MPLSDLQSEFARALINPNMDVPRGVVDPAGRPAPKRFDVYRNNVTLSLIEVLKSSFPAVCALVGDEFFHELARKFVRAYPPTSPLMMCYGSQFADFISANARLQSMAYIFDVAHLDWAWVNVYHASDAKPLDPASLTEVAEEQWPKAKFQVHPAARLISSKFPLVDIWEAARAGDAAAGIDAELAQWALVVRPEMEVNIVAVSAVSGPFIQALIDGNNLEKALENVSSANGFDLQRVMGRLLQAGLFVDVQF